MEYGRKIAELRKSDGMTQAELGKALNVTFQAVSKWERDESYPDFETLSKIARIFGVPITYFEDDAPDYPAHYESAQTAYSHTAAPSIVGMCTACGRVIYEGEEGETYPALVCKDCVERRADAKKRASQEARQREINRKKYEKATAKKRRNRGLIVSGIIHIVLLIAAVIGCIVNPSSATGYLIGYCVWTFFMFPFIAQLFWNGIVVEICLEGGKLLGGIGVIFSLDLEGIIFLIVFKILFFFIRILFFLLTLVFFVFVGIIVSPFSFIPAAIRISKGKIFDL